ncbi:MAG: hypothetical protein JRH20_26215 [Deltaproteobacteria bacterium]|nr:hypothetical protein [Deltaproteobacteria bacterium]
MGLESNACADGCDGCPIAAAVPKKKGPYAGWRLGVASLGYFIFPIISAFIGARVGAPDHGTQALGALIGLAAGMTAAALVAKRAERRLVSSSKPATLPSSDSPSSDVGSRSNGSTV